jgi:flavin-dependent dehydrogenase
MTTNVAMEESEIRKVTGANEQSDEPAMEFYLGTVDWGYGWCFPKADSVSIGIGCRMDKLENLQAAWTRFLGRIKKERGVAIRPTMEDTFKVPFGYPEWRLIGRRTMVVGDAAGLASPLTGEGIYYAIVSGSIAADVAVQTVESRNSKEVLSFAKRIREKLIPELESSEFIARTLMKSRRSLEIACAVAEGDRTMRELMIEFVVGAKPAQNLKNAMLKRMVTHHPLQSAIMGLG